MNPKILPCRFDQALRAVMLGLLFFSAHPATAIERVQEIRLQKGWNAIFLSVTPQSNAPETLFANTPIEIVATYFVPTRPVEFVRNPGSIQWKQEGWGVWYSSTRPDGFLSTLSAIYGNRGYLIYARQDWVWSARGMVSYEPVRWKADSFNLVGFCLDEQSPPTFKAFFEASAAHQACRIYRLNNGQWDLVVDPQRTQMRSGEAYWVYCKGGSDYQGPLSIKLPFGRAVALTGTGQACLTFANKGLNPLGLTIETVSSDANALLGYVITGIGPTNMANYVFDLPQKHSLPTLEAGGSTVLALQLRPEKMTAARHEALLKITTDLGTQAWVPVTASRADLAPAP